MHEIILQNKELIKVLYAAVIVLSCLMIVSRTHRLFHLSQHNGIRYFRNAFLFYGVAFVIRYFFGAPIILGFIGSNYRGLVNFTFEFFMVMAGFFLLYSLLWRKIEREGEDHYTSLFNKRIFVFYLMAVIIAIFDYLWLTFNGMFFSQIAVFFIATLISFNNCRKNGKNHRFTKYYFFAMLLSLLAWIANTVGALYLGWDKMILEGVYISNAVIFILIAYGVLRVTGSRKKCSI